MRTREQDVEPFVNLSEITEIELLIMRRMREFTSASSFSTAPASSKRKSEMTGTIDVFRMKPASVMLSVSARLSGWTPS